MLEITPIARFRSPLHSKFGIPRQSSLARGLQGSIVFEAGYQDPSALKGLDGFDRIWLIWGFSENPSDGHFHPTVRPPRLGGNERMGVWATRSPFRPNGLGLSAVQIDRIRLSTPEGPIIDVLGADLMDGTPIYDIKPYIVYADAFPEARTGFAATAPEARLAVHFASPLPLCSDEAEALREILSLDPRPAYHKDPERIYGLPFGDYEVKFSVQGQVLLVHELTPIR